MDFRSVELSFYRDVTLFSMFMVLYFLFIIPYSRTYPGVNRLYSHRCRVVLGMGIDQVYTPPWIFVYFFDADVVELTIVNSRAYGLQECRTVIL